MIAIPAARRARRRRMAGRAFVTADEKLKAIAARIVEITGLDRPVHIAAPTSEAAAPIAGRLTDMGIPFSDISRDDGAAVTLGAAPAPPPARKDGLHVIIAEPHDTRRADRWLAQRCGWGGAEGSHETMISLEDELLADAGGMLLWLARRVLPWLPSAGRALAAAAARAVQDRNEKRHGQLRRELLMYDRQTSRLLAFSGRGE